MCGIFVDLGAGNEWVILAALTIGADRAVAVEHP